MGGGYRKDIIITVLTKTYHNWEGQILVFKEVNKSTIKYKKVKL